MSVRDRSIGRDGDLERAVVDVSRLTDANVSIAKEIIGRYPRPKSALIPLLHLAQEQDGYVTNEAMAHIAELIGHTPAEVLRHGDVLRDVQVRAGRQVPRQHLRDDVVRAAGRRRADAPRRGAPRHQGRRHDRRRADHARARRVPGRLHRGAVPAGQLPLPLPGHDRPSSTRCSTTSPAGASTARSRRTARWPRSASTSRPTAASAPRDPEDVTGAAAVDPRTPRQPGARAASTDRRGARRTPMRARASSPATGRRSSRRASRYEDSYTLERYLATGGYEGLRGRARRSRRRPSTTRSERPPCSAAAAPASRPA